MVKTRMIPEQRLQQAAECLKVLAHPRRLRMVELILDQPRAVGELATACGLTVAVTSGHLRLLERCGLLVGTREGKHRYYAAGKPCLAGFIACIREQI